jgi:hypothetical protein
VLGATRAYKDWRVANGLSEEQEIDKDGQTDDVPTQQNLPEGELADDYADEDLKTLEEEDPLTLIDSLSTRVGTPLTSGVASSALCSLPSSLLGPANSLPEQSSASTTTSPTSSALSTTPTRRRSSTP